MNKLFSYGLVSFSLISSLLTTSVFCTEEVDYDYYLYEISEGYGQIFRCPKESSDGFTEEGASLSTEKAPRKTKAEKLGISPEIAEKTRLMKEEEKTNIKEEEDFSIQFVSHGLAVQPLQAEETPLNHPGRAFDKEQEVFGLSIDGGGVRGYIPAYLLNELDKALHDTEWGENLALKDVYDCIGGTSIGGILALGIGSDISTEDLLDLLTTQRKIIFPANKKSWIRQKVSQLYTCQYDTGPLEEMLQNIFGRCRLKEAQTDVFVTACSTDGYPYLLGSNIFTKIDFGELEMWKAARATSAAPTYFKACDIEVPGIGKKSLMDGGIWTNNPSSYVVAELVRKHSVDFAHTHVLSLGTGHAPSTAVSHKAGLWDVRGIVNAQFSSQQISSHLTTLSILGENNYRRLSPNFDQEIPLNSVSEDSLMALETAAKTQMADLQAYIKRYIGEGLDGMGLLGKEFRRRN